MASKAFISKALQERIDDLPATRRGTSRVIENFAVFIDTHRDQPHVGTFHGDIHRGECRPTVVEYVIGEDALVDAETGQMLQRHDKHMFVEQDWYTSFLVDKLIETGSSPVNLEGMMATSHLRDPRSKTYFLRSFRQMVMYHYNRR